MTSLKGTRISITLFVLTAFTLHVNAIAGSPDTSAAVSLHDGCMKSDAARGAVDEESFVTIGGIEQWITIHGDDCTNPVVLFLHGGPGNTLTPFADAIYGGWEKDFTLVQWDQRAAGKTWGRNPPPEESMLTIEQMRDDGLAVARYIAKRLGKTKVILLGGSWGSILGVHMIHAEPELFEAWVGVSQVVNKLENQAASYASVLARARDAKDEVTVAALEGIGAPPWKNPRNPGVLRRASRIYEAKVSTPAPTSWWKPSQQYATERAEADYEAGEDFSYIQFVGLSDDGMFASVDLAELGLAFDVPVYLIQGAEDLVTVPDVTKKYFDRIEAPAKKYVLVPAAGHDPNEAVIKAQFEVLKELAR